MREKNKFYSFYCKIADKFNISITSSKKIYLNSLINGKLDKDLFYKNLDAVLKNKEKRQHKTIKKTGFIIPSSYLYNYLLVNKFNTLPVEYNLSDESTYRVIQVKDKYKKILTVKEKDGMVNVFNGLTFDQWLINLAFYNIYRINKANVQKKSILTGDRYLYGYWCEAPLSSVYEVMNPEKRFDKLAEKAKQDFIKKIIETININNRIIGYYGQDMSESLLPSVAIKKQNNMISLFISIADESLFKIIENQKRLVTINSDFLTYGNNTSNHLQIKFYLAYRIRFSEHAKVQKIINIEQIENLIGKTDKAFIKSYMQYLLEKNLISSFEINRKDIKFNQDK